MKKKIIIITDCKDVAFNEMKLKIDKEMEELSCEEYALEPLVPVVEFSLINCSFLIRLIAELSLPGTIILAVVNPLKERPARIFGETKNGIIFVGANSGVFGWLIDDFGLKELYESRDPGFIPFGGKWVHSSVVSKLAAHVSRNEIGVKRDFSFLKRLNLDNGTIVHIDNFGLIKIKTKLPRCKEGQKLKIYLNNRYKRTGIFTQRMMNLSDDSLAVYPGSSLDFMPEIGMVRNTHCAELLGAKVGDNISFRKI